MEWALVGVLLFWLGCVGRLCQGWLGFGWVKGGETDGSGEDR